MYNNLELLSPAGDMERLQTALRFGADAVYAGGPQMQLRASSVGFSMDSLTEAVKLCHCRNKKLYITVNAFAYNQDIDALPDYAQALYGIGVDAVIVSDLGAISTIRKSVPNLPVHVSTQANCINFAAANVYADMGVKRIVLGREMSLDDIAKLRSRVSNSVELEAFVHGAMCMSYSGRCMLSAYLASRSANRGACAQSCRWNYHLVEEKRPNEFFKIEEDERGTTILSSFDLKCIEFLDKIIQAGVTSFKIEGRMKSPYYVATVTNAYRKKLDAIQYEKVSDELDAALERELDCASHRPYSTGFYFGELKKHAPDDGVYLQSCTFVGVVRKVENHRIIVEIRNRIPEGSIVEILSPDSLGASFVAANITNSKGESVSVADVPNMLYEMDCNATVSEGDILSQRK